MAKDPAFPFYASDWLGSTKRAMMTPAQRGAYIDLLAHQWGDKTCSLPDDDEALSVLSGLGEGWLNGGCKLVRLCFPPHPTLVGRIANPRLLELRAERDEWIEKSRKGGKASAAKRQRERELAAVDGGCKGGSNLVGDCLQPKGNSPSPSPSPSPKKKTSSSSCPTFTTEDSELAKYIFSRVQDVVPGAVPPAFGKWADEIRLMRERDGRSLGQIRQVFDWANRHHFWKANIRSVDKLRKQFETLLAQMGSTNVKPAASQHHDPERPVEAL